MLKSIKIQGFQSHANTQLEFHPGVNVILGASDSGKTSIIRALRWLAFNRPQGDAFRSHWGGVCSIEATFDDHTITRKKDKVDEYILNEDSFKAFRTEVPEDIIKALDINDINLQMQLDSPFLLSETPGAVAQHFNKVARLDKIDTGLQNVQSEIRSLTNEIKFKEKDIEKNEVDVLKFAHLEKMEIDIESMETLYKLFETIVRNRSKLDALVSRIVDKDDEIEGQSSLLPLEPLVDNVLELYKQKREKETKSNKLQGIVFDLSQNHAQVEHIQEIISLEEQVNSILNLYNIVDKKMEEKGKLQKAITRISVVEDRIEDNELFIKKQEIVFEREMPNVCPLCDTKLTK